MDAATLRAIGDSLGAGAAFLLIVALVGVVRGWWVPGYLYREKAEECEEWQRLALRSTELASGAVEVAKR